MKSLKNIFFILFIAAISIFAYQLYNKFIHENAVLKQVIGRLEAD